MDDFMNLLQFESPDSNSLGSLLRIELTLNYPRTAQFRRASHDEQKDIYHRWIDDSLSDYFPKIQKLDRFFELCKTGMVHVHLDMVMSNAEFYYPCGLVSDIVKSFLGNLPKRFGLKTFNLLNYNCSFRRYRCPSIVCQLREITDIPRALAWETYIRKSQ